MKKTLALLLTLVMLLSLVPASAFAIGFDEGSGNVAETNTEGEQPKEENLEEPQEEPKEEELSEAPMLTGATPEGMPLKQTDFESNPLIISQDGSYYLAEDINGNIVVVNDAAVTLNLNGKVLKAVCTDKYVSNGITNDLSASVIVVYGGSLTLTDGSTSAVHYFKYVKDGPWELYDGTPEDSIDLENFTLAAVSDAAKTYYIKVKGGVVTGGRAPIGGVFVSGGNFTMKGGSIVGNLTQYDDYKFVSDPGGVRVNGGNFTMKAGYIAGNYSDNHIGGVDTERGSFTMTGGSIIGNSNGLALGRTAGARVANAILGGDAVIAENAGTGGNSNLDVNGTITVSTEKKPTDKMKIGLNSSVEPKSEPITYSGANDADYSGSFFSDADAYIITTGTDKEIQISSRITAQPDTDTLEVTLTDEKLTDYKAGDIQYQWFKTFEKSFTESATTVTDGWDPITIANEYTGSYIDLIFTTNEDCAYFSFKYDGTGSLTYGGDTITPDENGVYTIIPYLSDAGNPMVALRCGGNKFTIKDIKLGLSADMKNETKAVLGAPTLGESYYCRITYKDSSVLHSDVFTCTHIHAWSYKDKSSDSTLAANAISACCSNEDGEHKGTTTGTLTISAPALTTYGGTESEKAILSASKIGRLTVSDSNVKYYAKGADGNYGTTTITAPKTPGSYKAEITIDTDKTAYVEYSIAPIQLTCSTPIVAKTKEYDGTVNVTAICGFLENAKSTDDVDFKIASCTLDNKNVGTGRTATVVYELTGKDAGKYLKPVDEYHTVEVTAKQLTVSNTTVAASKSYDGSDSVTVTANGTLNGVVTGEDVELDTVTATYADANVGAGKTVTVKYTIKGNDKGNYLAPVDNTSLTADIAKATPTVTTEPTASAITYGQTLANSTLSDGAGSVDGTFAWKTGTTAPAVSDSNTTEYTVVFTPEDTTNYNTVEFTVKLTVNKATPGITTAPTASAITYGQKLSDSTLTGGEGSVDGSFAWETGTTAPAVSDSNTTEYAVVFTPTDTANYNTAECNVKLAVSKATPIYTAPDGLTANEGQTLADVTLPEGFEWVDDESTSVGEIGEHTFYANYTPDDTDNYNTVENIEVTLTVMTAGPVCVGDKVVKFNELMPGHYTMLINDANTGVYDFDMVVGGYTIRRISDGMYVCFDNGSIVYRADNPTVWAKDDAAFHVQVIETTRYWLFGWRTKTNITEYYLNADASGNITTSKLPGITHFAFHIEKDHHSYAYAFNGDGTHICTCAVCGYSRVEDCTYGDGEHCIYCGSFDITKAGVKSVEVSVDKTEVGGGLKFVGWKLTYVKPYTTYTAHIYAYAEGTTVSKVEVSTDGANYSAGEVYTTNSNITKLWIKVTDANGAETYWYYNGTNVSPAN